MKMIKIQEKEDTLYINPQKINSIYIFPTVEKEKKTYTIIIRFEKGHHESITGFNRREDAEKFVEEHILQGEL